jgi:hypothetical protein
MINTQQRKRRDRLFAEDPKCRFCGILMVHPSTVRVGSPPKNMLTLEHLNTRNSPEREVFTGQPTTTICCFRCNQKRSVQSLYMEIKVSDFRSTQLRTDVHEYLTKKRIKIKEDKIVIHMNQLGQIVVDLRHKFDVMLNDNHLVIDTKGMRFNTIQSIRGILLQRGKNLLHLVKHLFTSGV